MDSGDETRHPVIEQGLLQHQGRATADALCVAASAFTRDSGCRLNPARRQRHIFKIPGLWATLYPRFRPRPRTCGTCIRANLPPRRER
jgi:hypothetical protein